MNKKIFNKYWGYIILAVSVTGFLLLIQFLASYGALGILIGSNMLLYDMSFSHSLAKSYLDFDRFFMSMTVFILTFTYAVFALWYYLVFAKKRADNIILSYRHILHLFFLALGFYCIISQLMNIAEFITPDMIAGYNEIIETNGIADLTFASTITTLLIAPVGEEIVYRGLTLKYLRRSGIGFMFANIIQALLFGLIHGNIVQSTYAFVLGIFLGYISKKYNTLKACIVFHAFFNFLGTYLASGLERFSGLPWFNIMIAAAGVIFMTIGMRIIKRMGYPD